MFPANNTATLIMPFPIFDSAQYYKDKKWKTGPVRISAAPELSRLAVAVDKQNRDWSVDYLQIADAFLLGYLGGQRSDNTFNRFKVEIERFTLWLVLERRKNPYLVTVSDIFQYLSFLLEPTKTWVSAYNTARTVEGERGEIANDRWVPFWARRPKGELKGLPSIDDIDEAKREQRAKIDAKTVSDYRPKRSTAQAAGRALGAFYAFINSTERVKDIRNDDITSREGLLEEILDVGNPVPEALKRFKKTYAVDTDFLAAGAEHRLTQKQWKLVLEAIKYYQDDALKKLDLKRKRDPDAESMSYKKWVRAAFIMTFLKANMLRISEICKTSLFEPKMMHIRELHLPGDEGSYWEYDLIGKGNKRRQVILPDQVHGYLVEYRRSRGLPSDMPYPNDNSPLLAQLKRDGDQEFPLSYSATRDQVQYIFNKTVEYIELRLKLEEGPLCFETSKDKKDALLDIQIIKTASTHWLRHTGASMALEDNENLKDVADTLGHSDQRITDQIYNRREAGLRAESAKKRKV